MDVECPKRHANRFSKEGVVENEICPILLGRIQSDFVSNPDEVEAIAWITWGDFLEEIKTNPEKYSPWCREEALILDKLPTFRNFLK